MQNLNAVKTTDFTQDEYRRWVEERQRMREGLESMAVSERWLCSKTRTPLENKLLAELRGKRRASIAASSPILELQSEVNARKLPTKLHNSHFDAYYYSTSQERMTVPSASSAATAKSESIVSRQKSLSRNRRNTLTEAEALSSHILHGRQRFVTLLTLQDPAGLGRIGTDELESILHRICPAVSQDTLEYILKSLPVVENGMIDYRPLLKGGLTQCLEKYFDRSASSLVAGTDSATTAENEVLSDSETPGVVCTMDGERGALATSYKDKEKRQFDILLKFCRERGIVLNRELLEKGKYTHALNTQLLSVASIIALLLPYDHSRESCLEALRQPGLDLLSQQFTAPPREQTKTVEREDYGKKFGWAYKEIRGKRKPVQIRIPKPPKQQSSYDAHKSGGTRKAVLRRVEVTPKVDCWLTFKEYQWLTR